MKNIVLTFLLVKVCLLVCINESFAESKYTVRRFAIVIGANYGGPKRIKLRYAVSDAVSIMKVLNEMGGVLPGDSLLLVEPGRNKLLSNLKKFRNKISEGKSSAGRIETIFYYSGHSDEEAVLLGNDKVSYKEIKDYIDSLPVDVRIAILDSCSSGAFTRIKGGKMRPPFLVDTSYSMKGYAFMTSSSMDEASQESDRIKGSFFTHYLVSGLRGAADMTHDGRVTLTEAYQYAYSETLAGTEKSLSGPQHPNYNIQMSGKGDVVITDIRKSSAVMILNRDISGRFFIRDKNDKLVCELKKSPGGTMQFGLAHGNYSIVGIKDGKIYKAEAGLVHGNQVLLTQNNFVQTGKEVTKLRGDDKPDKEDDNDYTGVPWSFSLYPHFTDDAGTVHYYSFNLFGSYCAQLDGFDIGLGPAITAEDIRGMQLTVAGAYAGGNSEGMQFSVIGNITRKDLSGVQISEIFSYTGGDVSGVQLSGLFNYAGDQLDGTQVSGLFNYTGVDTNGLQLSGIFNYTGKNICAVQLSGICNIADNVNGVQVAGITNIADNTYGSQIGLVNIADDFDGLQLGLVNISKTQNGIPIGLINISKNGSIDISLWGSSLMAANTGVTFRANYIYTVISAGWYNLYKDIEDSLSAGFSFGVHIPVNPFYINLDAGYIYIDNKNYFSDKKYYDEHVLQCRLSSGYNITDRFAVFAGGGVNYICDIKTGDDDKNSFKDGNFEGLYFVGVKYSVYKGD